MKNIFTLVCLILATIIGAGFASGKEIVVFFSSYGLISFTTITLSFFLFYFSVKLFLNYSKTFKTKNIFEVNKQLFGKFSVIFNLCFLFSYCIVLAGMYAGIYEVYLTVFNETISKIFTIFTVFIVVFVLIGGLNRISKFNNFFIPLTILLLIISAILSLKNTNFNINFNTESNIINALISSVNYVGINMLLASSILLTVGKDYSKKHIKISSIISCLILVLLIFLFNFVLINQSKLSDLPMATISGNINKLWGIVVLICIWFAIFSSILSVSYTIVSVVKISIKCEIVSAIITSVLGYVFSLFGFNKIVECFYPLIGALGIFLIIIVFIKSINQTTMQT